METPFSFCSHLLTPPLPMPKCFVDVYLFPTLKKGKGEATFHEGREENLHQGKSKVGNFPHMSNTPELSRVVFTLGRIESDGDRKRKWVYGR